MSRAVRNPSAQRSLLGRGAAALATPLLAVLLATAAGAAPVVTVVQDRAAFDAATHAQAVPFPADADTALPSRPFSILGLVGHSCTSPTTGVDLGPVTVTSPTSGNWLCFIDGDWNAGLANVDPTPSSPTIIAEGEDDLVITLDQPASAVGLALLTNRFSNETVTLTFVDGTTAVFADAALGTAPNALEFVGFRSPVGITRVAIDTTGGGSQNAGLTGISLGREVGVTIDIKPGDRRNCANPAARGVIPVAVLTTADFDAATVDPTSLRLEGAAPRPQGRSGRLGSLADVDRDGDRDLLVHIGDPSVLRAKTSATLTGTTRDGTPISGFDVVCNVPAARPR